MKRDLLQAKTCKITGIALNLSKLGPQVRFQRDCCLILPGWVNYF